MSTAPSTSASSLHGMDASAAGPEGHAITTESFKPLDKRAHWGNFTKEQEATLSSFETLLEKQGCLPDKHLEDDEQRGIVLSRFLRAREWNVDNALKMYHDMVRWRNEVDLDTLMKPVQEGGYDFKERRAVADRDFHSTDRYNRPIFVQNLSHIHVDEVFQHTTPDRIVRFFAVNLGDAVRNKYRICTNQKREAARKDGQSEDEVRKIVIDDNFMILNIEGLGMGTFWSFKNKLQHLLGILDANFPELSGRVQIINAPWLFSTIWSYIKPWLPVNTAAKIDIAGVDYKAVLFEHIDPSDLPVELGGTCRECKDVEGGCAFSNRGPWQHRQGDLEKPADKE